MLGNIILMVPFQHLIFLKVHKSLENCFILLSRKMEGWSSDILTAIFPLQGYTLHFNISNTLIRIFLPPDMKSDQLSKEGNDFPASIPEVYGQLIYKWDQFVPYPFS